MTMQETVTGSPRRLATRRRFLGSRGASVLWGVIGIASALALWDATAWRVGDPAILPGPAMVLLDVVDNFWGSPALAYLGLSETSYLGNLAYSSSIVITAWGVGAGAGLAIGLLAARVQWVRDLSEPILLVFGAVPVLVAAPFAVIWFGFGPVGQWILVGFFCWATVAVVAMAAALQVPPYFEEYAASLGVPERRRFAHIILPATLPAIGTGLRAALAAAWGLQAVAELMGSEAGVGRVIAVRANTGDVAAVLGLIITLGLVAVIADRLLVALLRKVITWN